MSLEGNHSDMVKFSEFDRNGYAKICNVLKDFVRDAPSIIRARLDSKYNRTILLFAWSDAYITWCRYRDISEAHRILRG